MYHGGGGEQCSIEQKPPLIKKVYHKVNKYLTIWNGRDLLIYSKVLNLVPNHGTRILLLVGYYGLVLLFWQIRVFCLMSFIDWNPSPDQYISAYAHYYYTSHIMLMYIPV